MPVHRRVHSKDEELGKRDDAFQARRASSMPVGFTPPWRWRKRRVLMVIVGVVLLYVFIHNIPTDLGPIDERLGMPLRPGHVVHGAAELREPTGPPPKDWDSEEGQGQHYYNGPIKFYRLATTLHGIARTMGSRQSNRNVLFAASSLKSVANLIPMACEMGKWDRNYVHLAVLGRDALPLEDILDVNGVHRNSNSCTVYFHDARADYAEYSTEQRAEVSVFGAMKHINDFMHPQAIIMDDSDLEEDFFTRAIRKKAKEIRRALIEVPAGRYEDFLWMTRLDSGSLSNWYLPSIDILVHAPQDSSGGLIRLVKSLERADYSGLRPPKLTIELPNKIEYFAKRYLEYLGWPPDLDASPLRTNALSLRHRIPSARVTSEQASLRFLESFYPTRTGDNHILILSSQAEVDPLFLQYLYYVILEYRYSSYVAPESDDLLGISLDVPNTFLNGTDGFTPPSMADISDIENEPKFDDLDMTAMSPFLYQAPSSAATLIFGDKWATFHHFLSNRIAIGQSGKAEKPKKLVSETEPAWIEYLLELMRARGWNILHPAAPFVTVHNELAQIPEEYLREIKEPREDGAPPKQPSQDEEEPFLTAPDPPALREHPEQVQNKGLLPLQDILPFNGDLPELPHLPHLDHRGELNNFDTMRVSTDLYVARFRQQIGGCDANEARRKRIFREQSTDDLFCLPGIVPEYDEEKVEDEEEAEIAEAIARATEPPESDDESTPDPGG